MMTADSPDTRDASTLENARRLHELGFTVIPLARPGGHREGKTPSIRWRTYQKRRPSARELVMWFSGQANIGVVTGQLSDVVVVDCDEASALRYWTRAHPYTPWQVRTARGWHLYYRHPGVRIRNRVRIRTPAGPLPLDIRADGGYVVAAGSVHASGTVYAYAGDWSKPREAVPPFRAQWLEPEESPRPRRSDEPRPAGEVTDRARRYLAAIPRPEIGAASDVATLFAACRLVRGFGLTQRDAEQLLWDWAGGRPGWTRAWIAQKVQHAARYGTEPIGALR